MWTHLAVCLQNNLIQFERLDRAERDHRHIIAAGICDDREIRARIDSDGDGVDAREG